MTPALWSRRSLVVMVTCSLLGLCAMILASYGASGEDALTDQVSWLNLAVIGSVIAGAGQASLLITGRRLVALRRDELADSLRSTTVVATTSTLAAPEPGQRVRVADGTWHHAPDCTLVRGKAIEAVDGGTSLSACAICGAG